MNQFPHFLRKINASFPPFPFRSLSVILILIIIVFNLCHNQLFETNLEKNLQQQIMFDPQNSFLHEKLGQYYLSINAKEAEKEYLLSEELYQQNQPLDTNVLGVQSSPWQNWLNIVSLREKLRQEIKFWQEINTAFPDYQYALLKLAALEYQLGEKEESAKYLKNLLEQNPTNGTALKLMEKIR